MNKNKKKFAFAFLLSFGCALGMAQEVDEKKLEELLKQRQTIDEQVKALTKKTSNNESAENKPLGEDVLVTVDKRKVQTSKIGRSYTVINRKTLEETGAAEVLEALRAVEGMNIVQTSTRGGTTSVFTRGGEADFTKVLINGFEINSDGGAIDLDNLITDDVERIEVVRGPGSSIHGSTAMTGVINIITKRGQGDATFRSVSEFGSFGTLKESLMLSGGDKRHDYMFSYSYLDQQDGRWHNGGYKNRTFSGNYGFRPNEDVELRLTSRYVTDTFGQGASSTAGPRFDLSDGNDENREDHMLMAGEAIMQMSPQWESRLKLSRLDEDVDFITEQDFSPHGGDVANSVFSTMYERTQFNWHNDYEISENYEASFGYDFNFEEGRNTSNTDLKNIRNNGIYVNGLYSLTDDFHIDHGARFDTSTKYGDIWSGNLALSYNLPSSGTKLKASAGSSFKAPSFFEIRGSSTTIGLEASNKSDKVEKNVGFDAGFEQKFWEDKGLFAVTYFENHIRGLVEFVVNPSRYEQGGKALTKGWEFLLRLQPHEDWRLNANWTLLTNRVKRTETIGQTTSFVYGDSMLRRGHSTGNVSLNYQATKQLNLNLSAHYVGAYDDNDWSEYVSSGFVTVNRVKVSEHTKTDFTFNYDLEQVEGMKLFGTFENILDENYDEPYGFPAEKSNFLGGVSYTKKF